MPSFELEQVIRHPALGTRHWREILGAVAVLISRLCTLPKTFWEGDELLFAAAIQKFDPWSSRPHPPGYPLYVGLGKFFAFFTDPFHGLLALSVIASVVGFIALSIVFRHVLGDRDLAVCGALLYYFSAAMLVHGALPLSDGPSLMFVALMLWAATGFPDRATEWRAIAFGLAASAAIGTRPQLVVGVLPVFLLMLFWTRDLRKIAAGLISFTILSMAWFAPLMRAAGGWDRLMLWETQQATYVATHDAAMSRGAASTGVIVSRFLAHPWGPKWISIPLALLALVGIFVLARKPKRPAVAIVLFALFQFALAIWVMDPADGARYSLPHMILVALLVAAGLDLVRRIAHMRAAPWIAVVIFAIASLAYAWPIIGTRAREASPPAAAVAYANAHFSPDTVIAYELSLRPHAEHLFSRFQSIQADKALAEFYDRPEVSVVVLGDGGSRSPEAKVFAWPECDAYGKLTRNHYRVVTLDPLRAQERYLPLRGVYALERTPAGDEWRWLTRDAAIRLPQRHGSRVTLRFRLSPDAPYDANAVHVAINGRKAGEASARRDASSMALVVPPGPVEITIRSDQAFTPATVLHNQDPRILAVQLVDLQCQ